MICNKLGGGENVKNIIVLEDNPKINKILQDILINEGYSVFSSFNAFEALKDFNANSIDCILTDLMLPIMSGEEFIQEIRKTSNVHIIVIMYVHKHSYIIFFENVT